MQRMHASGGNGWAARRAEAWRASDDGERSRDKKPLRPGHGRAVDAQDQERLEEEIKREQTGEEEGPLEACSVQLRARRGGGKGEREPLPRWDGGRALAVP